MDQVQVSPVTAEQRSAQPRFTTFFRDVKQEFKKISWTSKNELIAYTKVVFASIFIGGFILYGMDLLVRASLTILSALVRLIGGN